VSSELEPRVLRCDFVRVSGVGVLELGTWDADDVDAIELVEGERVVVELLPGDECVVHVEAAVDEASS